MGNHVLRTGPPDTHSIDQEPEIIAKHGRPGNAVAAYGLAKEDGNNDNLGSS